MIDEIEDNLGNLMTRPWILALIRFCLLAFLYILNAVVITYIFLTCPGLNNWELVSFESIVTLKTQKPFITRTLVPSTLREIKKWIPSSFEEKLKKAIEKDKTIREKISQFGWDQNLIVEYFFFCSIVFGCYLGFELAMRALLKAYDHIPEMVADFAPLLCLLTVVNLYSTVNYVYDPMVLLLSVLAFLFLVRGWIVLFTLVYVLACFNKETAILLVIPFFFLIRPSFKLTALMVGIWIVIRMIIFWMYWNYPGAVFEMHLGENLTSLGIVFTKLWKHYLPLLVLGLLIAISWSSHSEPLKKSFLWMLAILIFAWLISGRLYEIRVFYEIYPLALLLAVPGVIKLYEYRHVVKMS